MTIRTVLRMGEPLLYEKAEPVTKFGDRELEELIADMFETMESLEGAGIAAPQIGISRRIVIFGVEHNTRYPDAESVPMTVLINPEIELLSPILEDGWEGCLSVPGLRGLVGRYQSIRYRGFDQHGQPIDREAHGFHARVVQHECDHLDGILFPMRIDDLRDLRFEETMAVATPPS